MYDVLSRGKISKWLTMVLPCFDWLQQLETHTCGKCQANVNFEQSFLTKGAKPILINWPFYPRWSMFLHFTSESSPLSNILLLKPFS